MFNGICFNYSITKQAIQTPCGYYLYPRSSTGSKRHLDSLIKLVLWIQDIEEMLLPVLIMLIIKINLMIVNIVVVGNRLVQICAPNITYLLSLILFLVILN